MIKFVAEKDLFDKDPWLPEALMHVAYHQAVLKDDMEKTMNIDASHADKLVELLEEFEFVKTQDGEKRPTFSRDEYLKAYQCTIGALEFLFATKRPKLDERLLELDSLLPEALRFAVERGTISATALMRRHSIGYPRAAKIIDIMESEGFISKSDGKSERQVLVKKGDFDNMSEINSQKQDAKNLFDDDKKAILKERKKDFGLDKIKFLDENEKPLNANKSKQLKTILTEQFCGIGLICIEIQEAEAIFKKNNNVMHCKTFENPSNDQLQNFIDENKLSSSIILFEGNSNTLIADIEPLIPKIESGYFAVSLSLPADKKIRVEILY